MKSHCLATGLGQSICGAAVTCPGQSPHTAGVCAVVAVLVGTGELPSHCGEIGKTDSFSPTGSYLAASMDRFQASLTFYRHFLRIVMKMTFIISQKNFVGILSFTL